MKLCLGTAQFGLDYGINNARGKIPQEEIHELLRFSYDNGITMLDTASAYGNSESVLGDAVCRVDKKFQIVTKYPANMQERPYLMIDTSLRSLKKESIYGYLFHNYSIFKEHPDYIDDFVKAKQNGKASKIGFSLYYPSEAEYILENNVPCDIVQVPYNIFDQRFTDILPALKSAGIEIHVRSVFLQGLFFIDPGHLAVSFLPIRDKLREVHTIARMKAVNISAVCLKFASMNEYIDKIVIGIDSIDNLKSNIGDYNAAGKLDIDMDWFKPLAVTDGQIILPFNWKK